MSMEINSVGSTNTYNTTTTATNPKAETANNTQETVKEEAAVYEKSNEKVKYAPDTKTMEKIKAEVLAQTENLRNLVTKLFSKQGETWNNAYDFLSENGDVLVEIDEETRKEAQALVAEDGYYGVQQTTDRIVDFAKAISGGDPSKIDMLREAVQKGFENAEKMWGGELPEISKKTYDSVMAEFDKWKNEANGVAEE